MDLQLTRSYEPLKTLISDQPFLYFFLFLLPALLFFSFSLHSMDLFRQVMLRLIGLVRHLVIEFVVTLVDLFRDHLFHKRLTLRFYHISSLKGLVGQLANEFVITLVEGASEWAPGDLRQLQRNIITRNYAIQVMLLLWDIEDDAEWNSAENEDEDGGESSNYILANGKDCLYRLAYELGDDTIAQVAFQQLPVYLTSPSWQERLAGLVALSQINLFWETIPNPILEQVLTVTLNLFQHHPHRRVRRAAINAIDELFYKSNRDFQLQCYNRVLPALSGAIYEDTEQCVTSAAFNAARRMYRHFDQNLPLSEYLYPDNWQKCLFGLVAIAQIAKFRPQVEILNLEHVLTRVLSLFQDPRHPGVRWAAIDAIGHLSNYVGPTFQLRFQDCVLQTLTSALWDIQETHNTFDQLLLDLFQNSHRPVRSAAIAAILELSNGLAPTLPAPEPLRVRFHHFVLPALVAAMSAFQYPEVQDDAASAMEIISENYPEDTSPYLCLTVDYLLHWLCGGKRHQGIVSLKIEDGNEVNNMFGSDDEFTTQIPSQAQTLSEGSSSVLVSEYKPSPDVDYLQELLAIQQQGPRNIGFFGTRNMGFMHQELIEILSYAMVITKNHIFTSGASGTNAAVIRGALRAERPELLTVILPQSLKKQPPESQELLSKVKNVIEKPHNDHLPLIEASRLCNMDIISQVQQVICFAFHDSRLLMETCQEAKNMRKIVTLFYLD